MSDIPPQPPLPEIGQPEWGEQLNTFLEWVSGYAASNDARVSAIEARPDFIFNSAPWMFNAGTPPAGNQQVRLNNTDPKLATLADFRRIDVDGADRTPWFRMITPGGYLRIYDWDDADNLHQFKAIGEEVMDDTNVQVPIEWDSGSGSLPNGKVNVGFFLILGGKAP